MPCGDPKKSCPEIVQEWHDGRQTAKQRLRRHGQTVPTNGGCAATDKSTIDTFERVRNTPHPLASFDCATKYAGIDVGSWNTMPCGVRPRRYIAARCGVVGVGVGVVLLSCFALVLCFGVLWDGHTAVCFVWAVLSLYWTTALNPVSFRCRIPFYFVSEEIHFMA